MWSVSAVSFHSAKGRAGQNSSRLSLAIFTWNELLLAALDLPRDSSQIQATHLNANIESRDRLHISPCKLLSHMQQKLVIALGLNFAGTCVPLTRALARTLV